ASGLPVVALAAACGPGGGGSPVADQEVTLELLSRGDQAAREVYEQQLREFAELRPKIHVNLSWAGTGGSSLILEKMTALVASGTAPDLYWTHVNIVPDLVEQQVSLALDPLARKDRSYQLGDLYKSAIDSLGYKDAIWGLPRETTSIIVYANQELFGRNGVPVPRPDWRLDSLVDAARRVTRGEGTAKVYGTADWRPNMMVMIRTWQNGGDIVNKERTASTIDSPAAIEAIQWVADLLNKHHVHPTPAELKENALARFTSGRLAMMPTYSSYLIRVRKANVPFEWDLLHLPQGKQRVTRTASAGHSIFRGAKHPDQAWIALAHGLTSERAFQLWAKSGLSIPSHKKVAASSDHLDPTLPPKSAKVMLDALEYARPEPITLRWDEVHDEMSKGLAPVWENKVSAESAARDVKQKLNAILARS
ncbi:MAG: ABC transporter substrate-binding protein, partial [Chloroflexota bacterium]